MSSRPPTRPYSPDLLVMQRLTAVSMMVISCKSVQTRQIFGRRSTNLQFRSQRLCSSSTSLYYLWNKSSCSNRPQYGWCPGRSLCCKHEAALGLQLDIQGRRLRSTKGELACNSLVTSLKVSQVGNQAWASWVDDNLSDLTRINNKVGRIFKT